MATESEVCRVVLEELRGKSKAGMMELPVEALKAVVWCHPLLLSSSWCLKMGADIVMAVCRWVPAQE
jgi:hypothetical protein